MKQAASSLIDLGAKVVLSQPIDWATENYETILEPEEAIASLQRQHPDGVLMTIQCFYKWQSQWANPEIEALLAV